MVREEFKVHSLAAGKRSRKATRKAPKVQVVKVNTQVWEEAMRLAGGDVHRLEILSDEAVRVLNSPAR